MTLIGRFWVSLFTSCGSRGRRWRRCWDIFREWFPSLRRDRAGSLRRRGASFQRWSQILEGCRVLVEEKVNLYCSFIGVCHQSHQLMRLCDVISRCTDRFHQEKHSHGMKSHLKLWLKTKTTSSVLVNTSLLFNQPCDGFYLEAMEQFAEQTLTSWEIVSTQLKFSADSHIFFVDSSVS